MPFLSSNLPYNFVVKYVFTFSLRRRLYSGLTSQIYADTECDGSDEEMNAIARSLLLCTVHFEHTDTPRFTAQVSYIHDQGENFVY